MAASNALGNRIPMFVVGKSVKLIVSRESRKSPVDIVPKKKAGRLQISLKNGFVS